MTYGFNGIGEPKIRPLDETKRLKTGAEKSKEPIDTPAEDLADIDPAEFFDPEEFSIRRREPKIFDP